MQRGGHGLGSLRATVWVRVGPVPACRLRPHGAVGLAGAVGPAVRCQGDPQPLFPLQRAGGTAARSARGANPPPPPPLHFPNPAWPPRAKRGPAAGIDVTEKVLLLGGGDGEVGGGDSVVLPSPSLCPHGDIVPMCHPRVSVGLRAARTPSHLVAPPPPQPPSFLITAAISSMAPAQHVTSLPWGGCAGGGGGGAGVSGEKRRTGGWARWKIPLLSPPRPQRRAFIRGYPPGGPDSILRPPLCHQRMERWRFVRPPLPSLLPRTAAMCEQRPGSSAAVPEGGGLCAPLDPPPA